MIIMEDKTIKTQDNDNYLPKIETVVAAKIILNSIIESTPLQQNRNLSDKFQANIFLKREDLQIVRSYKIRGAFNKIKSLSAAQMQKGIVCASAGNHAQGFAYSCQMLSIHGIIYMPSTTPKQKVNQVKMFGKDQVEVILVGDTYDDAYAAAMQDCKKSGKEFIHPFDDWDVIAGQATVGLEILEQVHAPIDYIFIPIGGGGLISGVGSYVKQLSPKTKIIGVEPSGAPAMSESLKKGSVIELAEINKFVDGAAVKRVGDICFSVTKNVIDDLTLVPEGKVCTKILELYNFDAIVVEPAGALSIAALDYHIREIKGKNVVCILSGSNNDITRTEEIKELSLLYEGLKHYFIIRFPQRSGALKDFVAKVLGPNDDITHFEYRKKTSREKGPALVGIELQSKDDFHGLVKRMNSNGFLVEYLNENPDLFQYII